MSDKLTTIEDYSFAELENLQKLTIPSNVTTIGSEGFVGCDNLKEIYIEAENLAEVGDQAFETYGECTIFVRNDAVKALIEGKWTENSKITISDDYNW